tara:strand:+ start:331 stop:1272 length:942 start_codon:yes stop_codon:yes gene_type:complete
MTKLKVDEIETTSTNQNLEVKHGGSTGSLEIKGDTNDGTLQLNCSAQSHGVKLKAPGTSLDWTAKLPENQIAANTFLKVKSVTGNEGELEFGVTPTAASVLVNLDASGFTSGTVPPARMPALPASGGLGLQLVNKTTVSSGGSISAVDFDLDGDSAYHIIGKGIGYTLSNGVSVSAYPKMHYLDSSSNILSTNLMVDNWYYTDSRSETSGNGNIELYFSGQNQYQLHHYFVGELVTGSGVTYNNDSRTQSRTWLYVNGKAGGNYYGKTEVFAHFNDATVPSKLRITPHNHSYSAGNIFFEANTTFLLYKFNES